MTIFFNRIGSKILYFLSNFNESVPNASEGTQGREIVPFIQLPPTDIYPRNTV